MSFLTCSSSHFAFPRHNFVLAQTTFLVQCPRSRLTQRKGKVSHMSMCADALPPL